MLCSETYLVVRVVPDVEGSGVSFLRRLAGTSSPPGSVPARRLDVRGPSSDVAVAAGVCSAFFAAAFRSFSAFMLALLRARWASRSLPVLGVALLFLYIWKIQMYNKIIIWQAQYLFRLVALHPTWQLRSYQGWGPRFIMSPPERTGREIKPRPPSCRASD